MQEDDDGSELDKKHRFEDEAVVLFQVMRMMMMMQKSTLKTQQ